MVQTPRLYSWMSGRTLLFLFVPLLLFYLLLFNGRSQFLTQIIQQNNPTETSSPIIDTWFAYSPDRLFRVIGEMGDTGRQFYALTEVSADLVFPLLYTPFLFILLALLLPRAFRDSPLMQSLQRLPLLVFLFDYSENCGLFYLLMVYPLRPVAIAWITSAFTSLKTLVLYACLLLILASLVMMAINVVLRGRAPSKGGI
jgi:hypothetical protein